MKKRYILLICLVFLFMTGCKEEKVAGDIITDSNEYNMTTTKELDVLSYHIRIKATNEGMEYNNTIFSFLVNDTNGMYIYNDNKVTNDIILDNYKEIIDVNDKEYSYYIENDTINAIYKLNDTYYLSLSIKAMNNDIDTNSINSYFELFNFEVESK